MTMYLIKLVSSSILVICGLLEVLYGMHTNNYQRRIHGVALLILASTL